MPHTPLCLSRREILTGASAASLLFAGGPAISKSAPLHIRLAEFARSRGGDRLDLMVPDGSQANLQPIVAAFAELSGVEVRLVRVPVREVGRRLIVETALGTGSVDVALPGTFEIPDLVAAGAIRPLDVLPPVDAIAPETSGEIYVEGDSFDGVSYGYQTDGDSYLMFYNGRLLADERKRGLYEERFGRALAIPEDWEELDRQILFFDGFPDCYGATFPRNNGYVDSEYWVRLHAKGVWPLASDLSPQFTGDAGVTALEDMIRIGEALKLPSDPALALTQTWENFDAGNAYASMGWGGSQKYFRRSGRNFYRDVLHAPLPGAPGVGAPKAMSYFNWGWSYVIPQGARDPELAHAFSLFAVSPEMSRRSVSQVGGFFDPFRREHYDDPTIEEIYGDGFLRVHRATMENAIPDFYLANRTVYFDILGSWLEKAVARRVPPEEALARVADEWALVNVTEGVEHQARRWNELRAKYPAEIRNFLRDGLS